MNTGKTLNRTIKYLFLLLVGGFSYFYLEILYRGYSHYSMIICGGLAFILCGFINQKFGFQIPLIIQMFISAIIITSLELITGILFNIVLGANVWDYSNMPYNLYGQICLAYSTLWFFLSLICIFADDFLRHHLFNEKKATYRLL